MKRLFYIIFVLLAVCCAPKKKTETVKPDLVYPENGLFVTGYKNLFFGELGYRDRSFQEDTLLFPPIEGLVHGSAYAMCPTDTCFAEYAVLALRCPPIQPLLDWVADMVNTFVHESPIGNGLLTYNEKQLDIPIKHLKSDKEICDYYIGQLQHVYDDWHCTGEGDRDSLNEQAGLLLADCWHNGNLYTFYRIDWYDWMSCGNNARESWWTVDATSGKRLGLEDFILPEKLDTLAALMMPRLINGGNEFILDQYPYKPEEYTGVLQRANGCALIPEGLVFYFYPYNLGSGADGQYEAVIPYEELDGILNKTVVCKYLPIPEQLEEPDSVSFAVRIHNDSLFVDNALYFDRPFVIPLVYKVPKNDNNGSIREEYRQARLKNPRRVHILFSEPINSFSVQAVLHPDDERDEVGMAEWVFSKGKDQIKISTGFYWDWVGDIIEQFQDSIKYQGETYSLSPAPAMVQGKDSIIVDTPFCFKDVDFDGKDEICFRGPGWNRYYFNAYKIVSATKAKYMTGHPYNNIVYSDSENCLTVFNYDNQTIHMVEVSGSSVFDHLYGRRTVIKDVLNPMRHISGEEVNYSGGSHNEDCFEDGKWVKSIIGYPLDDSNWELEAEYVSPGNKVFSLNTLTYYKWDMREERRLLYQKGK